MYLNVYYVDFSMPLRPYESQIEHTLVYLSPCEHLYPLFLHPMEVPMRPSNIGFIFGTYYFV